MRYILHVDMNAFFASCERANNIELKEKPIIVAGDPKKRHGIVIAATYDAKSLGVKTTMPLWKAKKLCKKAVVVKSNHDLYKVYSKKVMDIFDEFTPKKEQISIDEAYLDMGNCDDILKKAKKIQERILEKLDLKCSIGISNNKFLAKMASDMKKPMGITMLLDDDIENKLWPLDIGKMYGVGKKTKKKLKDLGIIKIKDLAKTNKNIIIEKFGYKVGSKLHENANGKGSNTIVNKYLENKSMGNEITFSSDINDYEILTKYLKRLSDKIGNRLREKKYVAKTISIKLKYENFDIISRSKTVNNFFNSNDLIFDISKNLFDKYWNGKKIRLIGVTVRKCKEASDLQLSLFEELENYNTNEDVMLDSIQKKHGDKILKKGIIKG